MAAAERCSELERQIEEMRTSTYELNRQIGEMTNLIFDMMLATSSSPVYQDWIINGYRWDVASAAFYDEHGRDPDWTERVTTIAKTWVKHAEAVKEEKSKELGRILDEQPDDSA